VGHEQAARRALTYASIREKYYVQRITPGVVKEQNREKFGAGDPGTDQPP
jgi:hypothetical protein